VIKPRGIGWAENDKERNICGILMEKIEGKSYYEDRNVSGWIILKRILEK
jgi:hypothetical protein